jgi:hypothetical protein
MLLVDGAGLPLAIDIDSASPAEVTLIEPPLCHAVTAYVPSRLIYDRAADSDPLRQRLAARNIELICPHRKGRVRPVRFGFQNRPEQNLGDAYVLQVIKPVD